MSTAEPNQTALLQNNIKYVFNLFNIPQPYSANNNINNNNNNGQAFGTNERSPTPPSVLSESSVECFLSGHNIVSDAASTCSEESEELTNLTWLTELRNELLTWPESVKPIVDEDRKCANVKVPLNGKTTQEHISAPPHQKRPTAAERYNTFLDKVKKDIAEYDLAADIYQTDVQEKPPFNYSHIIGMAMLENGRMTLSEICSWIESKFAFFRVRKRWNNSIRHNLSLHHCFKKIDRSKFEKGKGGYWELGIDPKKCDRKRIRNRKSSNRNRNRSIIRGAEVQQQSNNESPTVPNIKIAENENVEEFVLDELDVQHNVVIQKDTPMHPEFLTSMMSSSSQTTTTIDDNSRLCPYDINESINMEDVFIANTGNGNGNNNYNKLSTSPNLSGDAEYELGTIIVNSAVADLGGIPSMNISDIEQQINIFVGDEIPEPCENVVISSYLSNETIGNQSQPNVIVEQMEPYCTASTSSESSFRPYIDGIDEAFLYLRSMDTRCDDLFDNLLDISVSIFCVILLISFVANGKTILNGNPTHLTPLIATTNNNDGVNESNNHSYQLQVNNSAQESIKIGNRHLYDTVKHASGYDPDANNNNTNNSQYASINAIEATTNNNNLSSSATTIRIHPRKSAVIQAIPRKVRGPGGNILSATSTNIPFVKSPSSGLQPTAKDYGAGEPTTTIVYATSIPTSKPSRTFFNIRSLPVLSSQKYHSTVVLENERPNHHQQNVESAKPLVEPQQQYSDDEQQQLQPQSTTNEEYHHQHTQLVLKKTNLRDDSSTLQSKTTSRPTDAIPPYQTDHQKKNPYKSVLYSRSRTSNDEDISDELSSNYRHTYYPNHKWSRGEDYTQRGAQLQPPPIPLSPALTHFVYENPDQRRDYYNPQLSSHTHPSSLSQTENLNFFRPRYITTNNYQEEMYSPVYDPMAQRQPINSLPSPQQHQYQPLTVRDFDLLLQLLVLREQRLHASHQDPFLSASSLNDFNCRNNQQENNNYYHASPKAMVSSVRENTNNFRSKYMETSLQRPLQPSTPKMLPSNVREELLFRMLLLALHLQPQTQSQPQPQLQPQPQPNSVSRIPTILPEHHHNMYLEASTSSSPPESSPFLGLRHTHRSTILKNPNPVRSVQVLGEID